MRSNKITDKQQLVSFMINEELFGIDIRMINEVNPRVKIVPIPLSEPHIKGHINIRGQVVLVLDLYVIFGKEPRPINEKSHIVIFKTRQDLLRTNIEEKEIEPVVFGDKYISILVDEIGDVINIDRNKIETSAQNLKNTYSDFTDGIARLNKKLLIIVNPVKILKYCMGSC